MAYALQPTKDYVASIDMHWMGDDYAPLHAFMDEANRMALSQEEFNIVMRHHVYQVKCLFTPQYYNWKQRLLLALYFITGYKPK